MRPITRLRLLYAAMEKGQEAQLVFGEALARARQYAGMTQSELAELYGVTPPYINNIELGRKLVSPNAAGFLLDVVAEKTTWKDRTEETYIRSQGGRRPLSIEAGRKRRLEREKNG